MSSQELEREDSERLRVTDILYQGSRPQFPISFTMHVGGRMIEALQEYSKKEKYRHRSIGSRSERDPSSIPARTWFCGYFQDMEIMGSKRQRIWPVLHAQYHWLRVPGPRFVEAAPVRIFVSTMACPCFPPGFRP